MRRLLILLLASSLVHVSHAGRGMGTTDDDDDTPNPGGCLDACGYFTGSGGWTKTGSKMRLLTLRYIGYNYNDLGPLRGNLPMYPDGTQSQPDDKLTIDRPGPQGAEPVSIRTLQGGLEPATPITNVMINDTWTWTASSGRFAADLEIVITTPGGDDWNVMFHSSCSHPLVVGDIYGSIQIVGHENNEDCVSSDWTTTTAPPPSFQPTAGPFVFIPPTPPGGGDGDPSAVPDLFQSVLGSTGEVNAADSDDDSDELWWLLLLLLPFAVVYRSGRPPSDVGKLVDPEQAEAGGPNATMLQPPPIMTAQSVQNVMLEDLMAPDVASVTASSATSVANPINATVASGAANGVAVPISTAMLASNPGAFGGSPAPNGMVPLGAAGKGINPDGTSGSATSVANPINATVAANGAAVPISTAMLASNPGVFGGSPAPNGMVPLGAAGKGINPDGSSGSPGAPVRSQFTSTGSGANPSGVTPAVAADGSTPVNAARMEVNNPPVFDMMADPTSQDGLNPAMAGSLNNPNIPHGSDSNANMSAIGSNPAIANPVTNGTQTSVRKATSMQNPGVNPDGSDKLNFSVPPTQMTLVEHNPQNLASTSGAPVGSNVHSSNTGITTSAFTKAPTATLRAVREKNTNADPGDDVGPGDNMNPKTAQRDSNGNLVDQFGSIPSSSDIVATPLDYQRKAMLDRLDKLKPMVESLQEPDALPPSNARSKSLAKQVKAAQKATATAKTAFANAMKNYLKLPEPSPIIHKPTEVKRSGAAMNPLFESDNPNRSGNSAISSTDLDATDGGENEYLAGGMDDLDMDIKEEYLASKGTSIDGKEDSGTENGALPKRSDASLELQPLSGAQLKSAEVLKSELGHHLHSKDDANASNTSAIPNQKAIKKLQKAWKSLGAAEEATRRAQTAWAELGGDYPSVTPTPKTATPINIAKKQINRTVRTQSEGTSSMPATPSTNIDVKFAKKESLWDADIGGESTDEPTKLPKPKNIWKLSDDPETYDASTDDPETEFMVDDENTFRARSVKRSNPLFSNRDSMLADISDLAALDEEAGTEMSDSRRPSYSDALDTKSDSEDDV